MRAGDFLELQVTSRLWRSLHLENMGGLLGILLPWDPFPTLLGPGSTHKSPAISQAQIGTSAVCSTHLRNQLHKRDWIQKQLCPPFHHLASTLPGERPACPHDLPSCFKGLSLEGVSPFTVSWISGQGELPPRGLVGWNTQPHLLMVLTLKLSSHLTGTGLFLTLTFT